MPARQNNDTDAVFALRVAGARREFAAALAGARGPNEPLELFSSEEEKIIQNGLDRLFYKRLLPNGGEKEQSIAKKLMKLLMQSPDAGGEPKGLRGIPGLGVEVLAEQYRETRGWYYTLKPLSDSAQARWMKREAQESSKAIGERNWDLIWFCKLRMEGIPTKIANFKMTCFFTLLRADSKRDRVVEIVTERGEKSPKLRLDAESFSTPSGRTGFRTWLMNKGNGCWKGGERELEDLQLDTAHDAAYMDVHEVTALGHDAASGLWFFEDCAFAPGKREDGSASRPYLLLLPDEDGVYWHEGLGYQLAGTGSGNQPFAQGLPVMHPKEVLSGEGGVEKPQLEKDKEAEWGMKFCLRPIGSPSPQPSPPGEGEELSSGRFAFLRGHLVLMEY